MIDTRQRPVRTTVLRGGRLSPSQRRALDELWPELGAEPSAGDDASSLFPSRAPLILDIGFGNGESLVHAAALQPDHNFLGVEVHPPGIGVALKQVSSQNISNVRIFRGDARWLLEQCTPPGGLAGVRLFFPDPWPKNRHHKRRIVQPDFVRLVASRLAKQGLFHLATDWAPYARWMLEALEAEPGLRNVAGAYALTPRPEWRPVTKFERRGTRLGHISHDLLFQRVSQAGR